MLLALAVVAGFIMLVLSSDGRSSRGATVDELASARAIAAARLRQFEEERQERFRHYHLAWTMARRRDPGRGYVLPFTGQARS